jgi:2-oxoglutarate ferredoxin oxidoreductase subunit alpha
MDKTVQYLEQLTIRFAGDSGDGMQLSGTMFSNNAGTKGNDVNSFPDYPSEIRAPEGTLYGVSAYQVQIAAKRVNTFGDKIDILVAMNASSLKVNLPKVKEGGIIITNKAGFDEKNLTLAKYESNPLDDDSLNKYRMVALDINKELHEVLSDLKFSPKTEQKSKNIFALGITYWLLDRDLEPTKRWLSSKFKKKPEVLEANFRALEAGYKWAANSELMPIQYKIEEAKLAKGIYRNITGNEAAALGLVISAKKANLPLFLGSYPITPATEILHFISGYKKYGVKHLQAEDEIAGISSAIGASFAGYLAATTTSGPGLSLKVEAMGLACILELPLVIINVQRAGPSTGLPTKPEQSDLNMALYGRHGEAPIPVIAAQNSADCFHMTIEATRIALKYMTPVILLTDGYISQGTNPFKVPTMDELPDLTPNFATDPETFQPYSRDPETLARPWAVPGTPGLEHRIGGLEKEDITGLVSHDPINHEKMIGFRKAKVEGIAKDIPLAHVLGEQEGDLLIIGWGGTYGAIMDAYSKMKSEGKNISYCHLKYLNPLPRNMGDVLSRFKRVIVAELNDGQLANLLQGKFLRPILRLNKIQGLPLKADEVEAKINQLLNEQEN